MYRCRAPVKHPPLTSLSTSQVTREGGEGQTQVRGAGPYPMVGYGDSLYDDPGQSQGPSRGPAPPPMSQTGQWVFSTHGQHATAPPSVGAVYDQLPDDNVVNDRLHDRFNADVVRFVPGQQAFVQFGYPQPQPYPNSQFGSLNQGQGQFGNFSQGQGQWGTLLYCYRCNQATTSPQSHQCRTPLPPSQVTDDISLKRTKAEMPLSASSLSQQPAGAAP